MARVPSVAVIGTIVWAMMATVDPGRPSDDQTAPAEVSSVRLPTDVLVAHISTALSTRRRVPVVVGIDGRSGAGKSTLAANIASASGGGALGSAEVTVIEGDDFYGGGSAQSWDRWSAAETAERVIDWRRQRAVLERLRTDGAAEWHPFDWDAEHWDGDAVPVAALVRVRATAVVILEGAYSCRPELHDLLDLRVLLDVPADVRRRQLRDREGEHSRDDWSRRWSAAEDHYFDNVMPPDRFDLVVGEPA